MLVSKEGGTLAGVIHRQIFPNADGDTPTFVCQLPQGANEVRPLSRRRQMYMELTCQGLNNAEIACRWGVSKHTVKNATSRLLGQLNARN